MIFFPVVDAPPRHAQELIDAGWFVLDVRTDAQWAEGRIAGSTHMALATVVAGVGTRAIEPVLVVTVNGGKGWRVAEYLRLQGLEAGNLEGGMLAWEAAGMFVER